MPLFDWPTAEEVLEDSGLRPEQVGRSVTTDSLLFDIQQKIDEAGPVVERRILAATSPEPWPFSDADLAVILPKYSEEQRTERQNDEIEVARKAIKLMALHYLYDRSGQLNTTYQGKANEYKADAEMIMTGSVDGTGKGGLLGELSDLAEAVESGQPDESEGGAALLFIPAFEPGGGCSDEFGGSIWELYR